MYLYSYKLTNYNIKVILIGCLRQHCHTPGNFVCVFLALIFPKCHDCHHNCIICVNTWAFLWISCSKNSTFSPTMVERCHNSIKFVYYLCFFRDFMCIFSMYILHFLDFNKRDFIFLIVF